MLSCILTNYSNYSHILTPQQLKTLPAISSSLKR